MDRLLRAADLPMNQHKMHRSSLLRHLTLVSGAAGSCIPVFARPARAAGKNRKICGAVLPRGFWEKAGGSGWCDVARSGRVSRRGLVLRGFAGFRRFPPPLPARPRPRARGDTVADRREQTPPNPHTRTHGTEVTSVWAMVTVSIPPSPGPPERCGVLRLSEILPYHASKATAYDMAP